MKKSVLMYEKMIENAMRRVVKDVLKECQEGLPGDHHFFISFRTRFPGVEIAPHIRARYPDEMTIVIQNQFWGLIVSEDKFEITLSFNRVGERLVIPYASINKFADPSVKLALEFTCDADLEFPAENFDFLNKPEPTKTLLQKKDSASVTKISPLAEKRKKLSALKTEKTPKIDPENSKITKKSSNSAEVVTLDSFRKK
jgi:hypothetical protein